MSKIVTKSRCFDLADDLLAKLMYLTDPETKKQVDFHAKQVLEIADKIPNYGELYEVSRVDEEALLAAKAYSESLPSLKELNA